MWFFTEWALWQQMTFVLACAISIVFVAGFVKLWWTNRQMARIEIIDAEKRAHASEMDAAGLSPPRKKSEVPFGIRAIQSGVEVDGIWISHPGSPATDSPPNSVKGKGKYVATTTASPTSTNSDPFASPASSRASVPQTYRPKSISVYNRITSQEEALRQLEGKTADTQTHQTYHAYQPRGNSNRDSADEYGSPTSRMSASYTESPYGGDVRVPSRSPPVNRHLNIARGAGGGNAAPKTGAGVRSFGSNLQLPKQGYYTVPQASPGASPAGEVNDPFMTPSRSPAHTLSPYAAPMSSQKGQVQGQHVKFAPDEYIQSNRHASDSSSGSS